MPADRRGQRLGWLSVTAEDLRGWLIFAVSAATLAFGAWRWLAAQFDAVRRDVHGMLESKVADRNAKIEAVRAEALSQISRCSAEAAKACNETAQIRLEMVRDYATRRDLEAALEKAMLPMQQELLRIETWMERLLPPTNGRV